MRNMENWREYGNVTMDQQHITVGEHYSSRDRLRELLDTDTSSVRTLQDLKQILVGVPQAIRTMVRVNGVHDSERAEEDTSYGMARIGSRYTVFAPIGGYTLVTMTDADSVRFYARQFTLLESSERRREYQQSSVYEVLLYVNSADDSPILGYSRATDYHIADTRPTEYFDIAYSQESGRLQGFLDLMKRGVKDLLTLPSPTEVPAVFFE